MRTPFKFVISFFLTSTSLFLLFQNCFVVRRSSDYKGEVIGVQGRVEWRMKVPVNMILIRSGSFIMGETDDDIVKEVGLNKQVTVDSFCMDKTPITNNQYRQFTDAMFEVVEEREAEEEDARIAQEEEELAAQEEAEEEELEEDEFEYDSAFENPEEEQATEAEEAKVAPEEENATANQETEEESEEGEEAAEAEEKTDQNLDKDEDPLTREYIEEVLLPDKNAWVNDFTHNMGGPMEDYHIHPAFDEYPVTCVSWYAANEFSSWRSALLNSYREEQKLPPMPEFRLPTEAEWEFASQGGGNQAKYAFGGPYLTEKGEFLANFKPRRGDYGKYPYTCPVKAFKPNPYGLYIGHNVREWCIDNFAPDALSHVWDLNPVYLDETSDLVVVKGASWKDIHRFLTIGSRDFEHKGAKHSYIGFRNVMPYFGGVHYDE